MLTPPRLEGTVGLPDGRLLSFAEYGDPHGRPLIWLHGTPGGRRQIPEEARVAAQDLGIRLVAVSRPGSSRSTPYLYDNVLGFVPDLEVLTDRLGIAEFGVIGLSGGGPYTLAAAHLLAPRVPAVTVLGGVAPSVGPDAAPGGLVSYVALLQGPLTRLRVPLAFTVGTLVSALRPLGRPAISAYARLSPPGDRALLNRPEFRAMFLEDIFAGHRPGLHAPIYDAVLFGRDWGFDPRDVTVPVRWWHGDADHIVPFTHAEHMMTLLPNAELFVLKGESHLGSLAEVASIFTDLLATWDRATA
ncbi:MAG TPA: alpha/beta hydrolase [Mycobacteriales bacterium]|jgi:pimeloyl-ACP methyl ester carboxylesterase|nr:alpha/beta hydrolase [Mycobacteriales bacterium]